MRLEKMDFEQAIRFLQRIHKKLNHELFNDGLSDIYIDIQNLNKLPGIHIAALYNGSPEWYEPYDKAIIFDWSYLYKDLAKAETQKLQALNVVCTMLHEMVHQYCDEYELEQGEQSIHDFHSDEWIEAAINHDISICFDNDGKMHDYPGILVQIIAAGTRVR